MYARGPDRVVRVLTWMVSCFYYVMLAGAGAEQFADSQPGIERVPNTWFDTDRRRKQLEEAQAKEKEELESVVA